MSPNPIPLRPPHRLLLEPIVRRALEEDLGRAGDVTSALVVPSDRRAKALLVARAPGHTRLRVGDPDYPG